MSVSVPGPKAASQRLRSSAWAAAGSSLLDLVAEPRDGRHPPVLPVGPGASRAAAHYPSLHRQLRQHPCACALGRLPARPDTEPELLRQQGNGLRQIGGERFAPLLERLERGPGRPAEPGCGAIRNPALRDPLLEPAPLAAWIVVGARRLDDRDELPRHDEQRAAHPEHADERALVVELPLDVLRRDPCRARVHRQKDGDRIGGMERYEAPRSLEGAAGALAGMDPMAPDESRSPLLDVDPVHAS